MARNWISTTTSRFLSTLSLRRATALDRLKSQATVISIHALLAESDRRPDRLWRAYHGNFYPRSPCGERLNLIKGTPAKVNISIHALLAESDKTNLAADAALIKFLSTLSLRRATAFLWPFILAVKNFYPRSPCGERQNGLWLYQPKSGISIHALLAESDPGLRVIVVSVLAISIHALLAESDCMFVIIIHKGPGISIHALLAESDYRGKALQKV